MTRQVYTLCVALLMLPIGRVQAADDTALAPSTSGYTEQSLPIGQRVRLTELTTANEVAPWQYGTVESSEAGSLMLRKDLWGKGDGDLVAVPLASTDRMQVRTGSEGHSLTGFIVGGSLGLIGGAAAGVGLSHYSIGLSDDSPSNSEVTSAAVGGAILGAFALGSLGAIVGSLVRTDTWEDVPLNRLQVGVFSAPDAGPALGMTLRFRVDP